MLMNGRRWKFMSFFLQKKTNITLMAVGNPWPYKRVPIELVRYM